MTIAVNRLVTTRRQTLGRILPNRFQKSVARGVFTLEKNHQRFLDETRHQIEHFRFIDVARRAHGFRRLEREAAREHRQMIEQPLLLVREQLVAPVDGRPKRLMSRQRRATPSDEKTKPVVESLREPLYRDGTEPSRRELQRERKTVEAAADVRDGRRVRVVESEARQHSACALHEKLHRLRLHERCSRIGNGERRHEPRYLAADAERLTTRRDDAERGTCTEQRVGQHGARADQVLTVVEHEQRTAVAKRRNERFGRAPSGLVRCAGGGERGTRDERPVRDGGELHPRDVASEGGADALCELESEARLAAPGGAGEREQTCRREALARRHELTLAPDEAGELDRKTRNPRRR